MKKGFRDLHQNEDWWAVWIGFVIIIAALLHLVPKIPKIGSVDRQPV